MGNSSTKIEFQEDVQHRKKIPNVYLGTSAIAVLHEVLCYIKLEADDVKEQNDKIQNMIKEEIIHKGLQSDPLFQLLFQNIFWTGSYYEGLKISAPNEFDLIMILKMPKLKGVELEVTTKKAPPGYVQVRNLGQILKHLEKINHPYWGIYKKMTSWCDENGSLLQSKVRRWIEGLIDSYLDSMKIHIKAQYNLKDILMSKQGPAFTIKIIKNQGTNMDIDLVPALEFSGEPSNSPPPPFKPLTSTQSWYVIPKSATANNEPDKWDNCWKVCCAKHEKEMISSKNTLKPSIKLIKRLRDERDWKSLKSYFIKTVAFWGIREKKIKTESTLDKVFLQLLKLLHERLDEDKLLNFWDPRHNMLQNMGNSTRINMAGELGRIIKQIEMNWKNNPKEIGLIIAPDREIN